MSICCQKLGYKLFVAPVQNEISKIKIISLKIMNHLFYRPCPRIWIEETNSIISNITFYHTKCMFISVIDFTLINAHSQDYHQLRDPELHGHFCIRISLRLQLLSAWMSEFSECFPMCESVECGCQLHRKWQLWCVTINVIVPSININLIQLPVKGAI